ncbi:MAG: lasso RiPP family leader peptide-containing protein [Litorilinea sp.]
MQKSSQSQSQSQNSSTRKAYRKPTLQEFGSVKTLTEGGYTYFVTEDAYYNSGVL